MKKSKYTDQQIAFALRQAETGTRVTEVRALVMEQPDRRLSVFRGIDDIFGLVDTS